MKLLHFLPMFPVALYSELSNISDLTDLIEFLYFLNLCVYIYVCVYICIYIYIYVYILLFIYLFVDLLKKKGGRIQNPLNLSFFILFNYCSQFLCVEQVQHHECLQGETVQKHTQLSRSL